MSVLIIPVDAGKIAEQDRKQQRVRVAVEDSAGVKSEVVTLENGKAEVRLDVNPKGPVTVAIGPENASGEDLFHLQTLTTKVAPTQWSDAKTLTLAPLLVTPQWWILWRRWCREFVISGRLVCADGSPVPGAEVRAYDVDYFWWWSSVSQAGPAVITDASGHFTITFRWCCGWYPWWWWVLRRWRVDPLLIDKIHPILQLNPALRIPIPDPAPSLSQVMLNPQPLPPGPGPDPGPVLRPVPGNVLTSALTVNQKLDPSIIPALRDKLVANLPQVPELQRLRIWPWWPWTPWFDCAPDIIFSATQPCGGVTKVVYSENIFQTRWDVPTNLNVTLVANSQACCLPPDGGQPEGDCALFTGVCGDPGIPVTSIGKTGVTAGYDDPGGRDRPFAETVYMSGQFGTAAQADYYELEYTPHGINAWTPVPGGALEAFQRGYFDATVAWPNQWFYPPFPVLTFGAHHVYESRHRYEATHPAAWGNALTGRVWFYNVNELATIQTSGFFADGTYDFRLVGYKALPSGDLDPATRKVMDGCGNHPDNNLLTLRFDNRIVGPQAPGTVHINTVEPDCDILSVKLGGVAVAACGTQQLQHGTPLEIDFFATDPDGHLDHYELIMLYDHGSVKNLLSAADVGSFTLTPLAGGPQGPDYSNAIAEGAVHPTWKGGTIRLHIDDASKAFPKTCCYALMLTAWKRNIVNCDGHLTYYNQMDYTFTITV